MGYPMNHINRAERTYLEAIKAKGKGESVRLNYQGKRQVKAIESNETAILRATFCDLRRGMKVS